MFDVSAKFQGTSLNENLLLDLDQLNYLMLLLAKFRGGKYAVMAVIKLMYHQVKKLLLMIGINTKVPIAIHKVFVKN